MGSTASSQVLRREMILGPGGDRMGLGGLMQEDLQQGLENLTKGPQAALMWLLQAQEVLKEQGAGRSPWGHGRPPHLAHRDCSEAHKPAARARSAKGGGAVTSAMPGVETGSLQA